MTREQAAEQLMKIFADTYYRDMYREIVGLLDNPVTYGVVNKNYQPISIWYNSLPDAEQEHVKFLIRDSILAPIFSLMVLFDGATGIPRIDGWPVVPSLVIDVFENDEACNNGTPGQSIKVAPVDSGEDLHDIFMSHVDEVNSTFP